MIIIDQDMINLKLIIDQLHVVGHIIPSSWRVIILFKNYVVPTLI